MSRKSIVRDGRKAHAHEAVLEKIGRLEELSDRVGENSAPASRWVRWFDSLGMDDVSLVGGKNASLGEMIGALSRLGVRVPDGFAVTAEGFRHFLATAKLSEPIAAQLQEMDPSDVRSLDGASRRIRRLMLRAALPEDLSDEIVTAYRALCAKTGAVEDVSVAVRSSATAEDLPGASFAGAHSTFLHVRGEDELLDAVRRCFASLYTPRAIRYRVDMGFAHARVALSVGVQMIVRSDLAASGVMFTLDTETGFRDVVMIDGAFGMGENIVQGKVAPDTFLVHKPTLAAGFRPLIRRRLGAKEFKLVYDERAHMLKNVAASMAERSAFCITDDEALLLAKWAVQIEEHYSQRSGKLTPMDIEWARDGVSGEMFIVQARPETVHAMRPSPTLQMYSLRRGGHVITSGLAVGEKIAAGAAHVIRDPRSMNVFKAGEILVTDSTDPDWEPIMKIAAGVVTERGGRTSHAAIVARELGIPAIVGAHAATTAISSWRDVTISCAEGELGKVYAGLLPFDVQEIDPATLPRTRTKIMLNVGDPEQAFRLAQLPNDGVGLARMEFIFASWIRVHPLALTRFEALPIALQREIGRITAGYEDKREYFVDKAAQGIGMLAAAFWPKPVILRLSDFKTSEYAHLLGGESFEPQESNPMLGWRGASRYAHPEYKEGFLLEAAAVKRVREEFGLTNLKLMVPFCRTPDEGRAVLDVLRHAGLVQGENGIEIYVMAEIPSNVILAEEFAKLFDGFSIGSNDLTQLVLGVDRDSERVAPLFDERNEAVRRACADLIRAAHRSGRTVGICGQAPSDYPEFAAFLVEHDIDSISLNPDSILRTKRTIVEMEKSKE